MARFLEKNDIVFDLIGLRHVPLLELLLASAMAETQVAGNLVDELRGLKQYRILTPLKLLPNPQWESLS